jgi:hypothetical protein
MGRDNIRACVYILSFICRLVLLWCYICIIPPLHLCHHARAQFPKLPPHFQANKDVHEWEAGSELFKTGI